MAIILLRVYLLNKREYSFLRRENYNNDKFDRDTNLLFVSRVRVAFTSGMGNARYMTESKAVDSRVTTARCI